MSGKTSVPIFDAVLPLDLEAGVTAISLVFNPAIQSPFVALAEQSVRLHLSQEAMKQVVTGPALVPDQPIFRLSGDNKGFYIRFSKDTVEAVSRRFMASANMAQTTDEHAITLQGNTVVESWIVTDTKNDKSAALGLNVPVGTWMLSVHIPDTDYWNQEIVSGNRTGFSIEALLDLTQPDLTTTQPAPVAASKIMNRKKNLFQRLMAAVFLSIEQVVDGPEIEIDEVTKMVYVLDTSGERAENLADGTYTLVSGEQLTVLDTMAITTEVEAAAVEELPADATTAEAEAKINELQAEIDRLKAMLTTGETATQSLKAVVAELSAKLSALPAAKPVKLGAQKSTDTTLAPTPAQIRLARAKSVR